MASKKQKEGMLKPITKKQLITRAKQSEKDIKQRKFISASAARKEMKKW